MIIYFVLSRVQYSFVFVAVSFAFRFRKYYLALIGSIDDSILNDFKGRWMKEGESSTQNRMDNNNDNTRSKQFRS